MLGARGRSDARIGTEYPRTAADRGESTVVTDWTRELETDPSVCYRHPGRQSWVLCQRCGRTVCPECQILAPVGVHCPDCVAETSGGVRWQGTNVAPLKPKRRRAATRVRSLVAGSRGGGLDASRTILAVYAALFVVGVVTGNLPFAWLAALPGAEAQLWRYLTAPFTYLAGLNASILYFLLSGVFFWLTAPQVERLIGVRRFLAVFAASSMLGSASMLLAGAPSYGLTAPLFGLFAALLVEVWADQRLRVQILVMTAINLLIALALGGLPALVGGMIGGAGCLWLLRTAPDRGWKPRTPVLITVGVCAVFVLLAVGRGGLPV